MGSTGKTNNFGLNQWAGEDKPTRLDFNSDNQKIDAVLAMIRNSVTSLKVLGVYENYESLTNTHPTGNVGDYYAVTGVSETIIYTWDGITLVWAAVGTISIALTEYNERIQACEGDIDHLRDDVETAQAAIAAKTPSGSLVQDLDGLHLVGDELSPSDEKFYGKRGGNKGFFALGEPEQYTPNIFGSTTSGAPVYNARTGYFIKIGRLVYYYFYINLSSKGGMAGTIRISTPVTPAMVTGTIRVPIFATGVSASNLTGVAALISASDPYLSMRAITVSSGSLSDSLLSDTMTADDASFFGSVVYKCS